MPADYKVVIGLGQTGLSCVSFLLSRGESVVVMDTRTDPPQLSDLKKLAPQIPVYLKDWDESVLSGALEIIVSPGLSLQTPMIARQINAGKSVVGDIELFVREARAPIIAVTGSNGKSTVVSMLHAMAISAGVKAALGGNIGVPVLDLLKKEVPEYYILEISSFQLMSTPSLKARIAVILNVSENHLDYHVDMQEYYRAKMNVYQYCDIAVCLLDDEKLRPIEKSIPQFYFTSGIPCEGEYGLLRHQEQKYLARGAELLLPVNELQEIGEHFYLNALAALAIGEQAGWPRSAMLTALKEFKGLPHRCRLVLKIGDVSWFNDSKATTVAATLAAINSLRSEIQGNMVLILGGIGKGADFTPLAQGLKGRTSHAILIGEAAAELERVLDGSVPTSRAGSLELAIMKAKEVVGRQGFILFSPACASYDMFNNFEHRGKVFIELVRKLG